VQHVAYKQCSALTVVFFIIKQKQSIEQSNRSKQSIKALKTSKPRTKYSQFSHSIQKQTTTPHTKPNQNPTTMSLFPRFPQNDFAPIFRLLDDYDSHRSSRGAQSHIRAFQPKFDVRELNDAYELHGELPGIDQKDMDIEFTDPHTLVVKGRVERHYEAGTPPQGRITGEVQSLTEQKEAPAHKATVEDENERGQEGAMTSAGGNEGQVSKEQQEGENKEDATYWVSERSVGEFHRSFSFPSRVDQDNVKAKLNNGVLTITVPKAAAPKARKINIE